MKQGLLWKEAPEPRFELFCESYTKYPHKCNLLFETLEEYNEHNEKVHNIPIKLKELPLRPKRRFKVTKQMIDNIGGRMPGHQRCWCGKPKDQWDSRHFQTYCSHEHRDQWWELTDYVGPHKNKFLESH